MRIDHNAAMHEMAEAKERHDALYDFWCDLTDRDSVEAVSFARIHHIAECVGYEQCCKWLVQAFSKVSPQGLPDDDEDIAIGKYVSGMRKAMLQGRLLGDNGAQK